MSTTRKLAPRGPAIPFAALSPVVRFVQAASASGPVEEIRATTSDQTIDLWVLLTDEDQHAEETIFRLEDELLSNLAGLYVTVHAAPLTRVAAENLPPGEILFEQR